MPSNPLTPEPRATSYRDPRASAQQFVNRNPLMGSSTGATGSSSILPNDYVGRSQVSSPLSFDVQGSARRRVDNVTASSQRIRQIYESGVRAKRERAAQERQASVSGLGTDYIEGATVRGAGRAWQSDGRLSESRNALLKEASSYLGTRYVLGGRSYRGIDCSGLVMNVYNKFGFGITQHHAGVQGRTIPGVRTSLRNLRPGDIVAWKDGSHIAIYAGNGEIIEAANPRRGTLRRRLWADPSAVYGIAVRLPGE